MGKKKTELVKVYDTYVDQARGVAKEAKALEFPWKRSVIIYKDSPEYIKARGLFPTPEFNFTKKVEGKLGVLKETGLISAADKNALQIILSNYYLYQK